eukprot:3414748-Amphidinium_carterae.1
MNTRVGKRSTKHRITSVGQKGCINAASWCTIRADVHYSAQLFVPTRMKHQTFISFEWKHSNMSISRRCE